MYDLQSNRSLSNRIGIHPDDTRAAVFTMGMQPITFPNRGTGYNFNDGTTGLRLNKRSPRFSGSWTETLIQGPAGIVNDPTWPRLVTSGTNHNWIHIVYNIPMRPTRGRKQLCLHELSNH